MIDTHCHLTDKKFASDRDAVISRAREAGVKRMICVLTEFAPEDISLFNDLISRDGIWGAAGCHPHEADEYEKIKGILTGLLENKKIVALGEIGLDYFYEYSPRKIQIDVFERQLQMAKEKKLPVIVHCREARDDCAAVLKNFRDVKTLLHCFSGDSAQLEYWLEQGYFVSFAGQVTFKNAGALRETALKMPLDRLLLETDAPYLAPQPVRGKRNEPAYVKHTYEMAAEIMGIGTAEFSKAVDKNVRAFFGV
ncbi:MAG: TatD family hydrolase [Candidatus Omnitrophota bacterium]|nr:TatD family deoxyribonuclease [Candidatus Omnitrophota bacterium]MBA3066179.1 TatD family deoxyribonuclease [bacterium]MBU2529283.1 TatD family hydrolase [bacterium]MBU3930254.1 TatD family hydrolase [bacterium]MBU4123137.1 TatD family hydrolase [bacterium]